MACGCGKNKSVQTVAQTQQTLSSVSANTEPTEDKTSNKTERQRPLR